MNIKYLISNYISYRLVNALTLHFITNLNNFRNRSLRESGPEKNIWGIIPLRAIIRVKLHSQFIPNSTGQQCNLDKAEQFDPNPPRAV